MCECNPPIPARYGNTDGVYCMECGEMLEGSCSDWEIEENNLNEEK